MRVDLRNIGKRFTGVQALADVNVTIDGGSIHGVVGENGAGKSTLGKVLAGVLQPDQGEIWLEHRGRVEYRSPRDALADGITIIAQELTLEPRRSIAENVFLGIERARFGILDRRKLRARLETLADQTGFPALSPLSGAAVGTLRVADQQKVEILRALARDAELIVMDEPTAALPADDAERLLEDVRRLRDSGTTIVYISHKLEEVLGLADTVTVLRDGRLIRTSPASEETPESVVTAMLGRPSDLAFPQKVLPPVDAPIVCSVDGLSREPAIRDISFTIRAGEIVGLAGLIGSGRTEIARAIFGADRPDEGTVALGGRAVRLRSPRGAINEGVVLLPESRKDHGLLLRRSVQENVTLPHLDGLSTGGVINAAKESEGTGDIIRRIDVRTPSLKARVETLSGGNQQKALFAKWLFRPPRLLIVDEPTRGVDVGAKRAIYELIATLASKGMAVLLISSELEEVIGLAHRVLVVREGRITAEFEGDSVTEDLILRAAFVAEPMAADEGPPE